MEAAGCVPLRPIVDLDAEPLIQCACLDPASQLLPGGCDGGLFWQAKAWQCLAPGAHRRAEINDFAACVSGPHASGAMPPEP